MVLLAADIEPVSIGEDCGIAIGRGETRRHDRASRHVDTSELDRPGGEALGGLHATIEAQDHFGADR